MLSRGAWQQGSLLIFAIMMLALGGCSRTPAEERIRHAILTAATAAREADAHAFGEVVSGDFDGNNGALERSSLLNMLRLMRLRGEKVSVVLGPVSVEPRGSRFVAHFTVTLGGGGRLLPDRLGIYRVETAWRDEDGHWRCYQAHWERRL